MTQATPLNWPEGWPRTPAHARKRHKFSRHEMVHRDNAPSYRSTKEISVSDAVKRVLQELERLGVNYGDAIISSNLQLRLDGLPRSDQRAPTDPGVAVYWKRKRDSAPKVMAIDAYDKVEGNLAAIAATLEAMRAIERHGGAQILERAFTGFTALPAPGKRPWHVVLGVDQKASRGDVESAYRERAKNRHPDAGGSHEAMAELNAAREQALRETA